jgi:hypothetical protein
MKIFSILLLWSLAVNLCVISLSAFKVIENPIYALAHLVINMAVTVSVFAVLLVSLTIGLLF